MKTFMKPLLLFISLMIIGSSLISCNRDDDKKSKNSDDPFIGTWKLKVVTTNGSSTDVSNTQCWKDSNMNVTATTATLFLSLPGDNGCQNGTESYEWGNENGTYYYTYSGEKYQLPVSFQDNNSTLQLNLSEDNTSVILSFTKL